MLLISVIWAFFRIELNHRAFEKKKTQILCEPEICVREIMFFLEKFTPLAKILHCRRHWRQWQISPLVVPFWFFWKSPSLIMQMVWPFKPLHCVNFLFTQLPHALCEFDNCLTKLSDVKKGESSCVGISLFRACLIFRILCELDNQELWWWQKCQPFRMSSQLAALC